jgi:ABC-type lipoprotein release transport system permease subunit
MRLAVRIAIRYLFAKKSQNIINVISWISVTGVLTGSLALLVVLSVFNGLHGLIGSLYNSFDPDLKIEAAEGKTINLQAINLEALREIEDVASHTVVLEDHALFRFGKRQVPGRVMGVDSLFTTVSSIDSIIVEGKFRTRYGDQFEGVLGLALADQLAVRLNFVTPLMMYVPQRQGRINLARPDQSFRTEYLQPSGIFMVNQIDYDASYLIADIEQTRRLLEYDHQTATWIGLKIRAGGDMYRVKKQVEQIAGNAYKVRNREEQQETFYKMVKVEKLMAYLILSFILLIALFNVIGTLSMLIFEKRGSISTLRSMGANRTLINRIFLFEGWLISLAGVVTGLLLGAFLIWLQQTFGLIRFQGEGDFVVEAYPVILQWSDVVSVFFTVSIIGLLAAWYPVRVIVRRYYAAHQDK